MSLKIASLAVGVVVIATSLSLWLVVAAREAPPAALRRRRESGW